MSLLQESRAREVESRAREVESRERMEELMNQLQTAEMMNRQMSHRLKLKIRRETQDQAVAGAAPAAGARTKASEPCNTCLKPTPRTCNVYGCRKHCCMKCVICHECEQLVTQQQTTGPVIVIVIDRCN